MANYVNVTLDTTSPSGLTLSLEGGASFSTDRIVDLSVSVADGTTTGYQIKVWGNVDTTVNANIQATEGASAWISYATLIQLTLSTGDGLKTIYAKVRDDVHNESAQASDTITLDTSLPVVSVTTPDVARISKITGKNTATFSFTCDVPFVEYKVKVVSSTGSINTAGTTIPVTAGSVNTSGTGTFDTSVTPINVQIKGADLETASAGDGNKIIKIFCRDEAGNWSA